MINDLLKAQLLSTGLFIENEYLDLYCKFIDDCKRIDATDERHHIIPRFVYKLQNKPVNNEKNNIIKLSHFNHCIAHYYLCLCTLDRAKYMNEHAFIKMVNIKNRFEFDFNTFLQEADKYNMIYEEFKESQKQIAIENHHGGYNKGKHCYTNGKQYVYRDECPVGYWIGNPQKNKKVSKETREKQKLAAKKRCENKEYITKLKASLIGRDGTVNNCIWINNGSEEKYVKKDTQIPDGWRRGRKPSSVKHLQNITGSTINRKLINNGIKQKFIKSNEPIPDGWVIGRLQKKENNNEN